MSEPVKQWTAHDLGDGVLLEHPLVDSTRVGKHVHILRRLDGWRPGEIPYFEVRITWEELRPGSVYPAYPGDAIGEWVEPPKAKRVIYLAHQLNAPTREGIETNRKSAARWAAFLATHFDVAPECSWIVLTGEFEETAENRERGLKIDLALVAKCEEVVMVGPRVSDGMRIEANHAHSIGRPVYNLTSIGMDPETVALAWLPSREMAAVATAGGK